MLAGMVVAVPRDGQQVHDPFDDCLQTRGVFRESSGKFPHYPAIEPGIVGEDGSFIAAFCNQRFRASTGRILAREIEETVVGESPLTVEDMQAELKRQLLVGSCPSPDRHGKHGGFEIEEKGGKPETREVGGSSFGVEEHSPFGAVFLYQELLAGEMFVRDIPQVVEAQLLQCSVRLLAAIRGSEAKGNSGTFLWRLR